MSAPGLGALTARSLPARASAPAEPYPRPGKCGGRANGRYPYRGRVDALPGMNLADRIVPDPTRIRDCGEKYGDTPTVLPRTLGCRDVVVLHGVAVDVGTPAVGRKTSTTRRASTAAHRRRTPEDSGRPITSSTSATTRSWAAGFCDSSANVNVRVMFKLSCPVTIKFIISFRISAADSGCSFCPAPTSTSSRSLGSAWGARMRESMIRVTTDSSVSEARPSPGTIRVATEWKRSGVKDVRKIAAARSAIELCSRVSARPTGAASSVRSIPNSTRPMTSIVSVRISPTRSIVLPGSHCATRLRAASTIAGAKDCTFRWLNTGCTIPRLRCQTGPSAVNRPSPINACSGKYPKPFTYRSWCRTRTCSAYSGRSSRKKLRLRPSGIRTASPYSRRSAPYAANGSCIVSAQ